MNSKPTLYECLGECRETYLADNLCDGYNCPKCNGHIIARGSIKELEEHIKSMQDKINRAKENGLIRKYNTLVEPKKYIYGVDYATGKDITIKINVDIEQMKKVEDLTKLFDNFNKTKRVGVIG